MAELWLLRVAGAGEGARAEICAFSGLYFFFFAGGGGGIFAMLL